MVRTKRRGGGGGRKVVPDHSSIDDGGCLKHAKIQTCALIVYAILR
jgi:hypothetical protein